MNTYKHTYNNWNNIVKIMVANKIDLTETWKIKTEEAMKFAL